MSVHHFSHSHIYEYRILTALFEFLKLSLSEKLYYYTWFLCGFQPKTLCNRKKPDLEA